MPIYAYRCESCGRTKDVLQRLSDPILTVCPFCDKATFRKQVTAAGFQLKGSGWYVTDFRGDKPAGKNGDANDGTAKSDDGSAGKAKAEPSTPSAPPPPSEGGGSAAKSESAPAPAPSPAPAPAPTPTGSKPG